VIVCPVPPPSAAAKRTSMPFADDGVTEGVEMLAPDPAVEAAHTAGSSAFSMQMRIATPAAPGRPARPCVSV